MTTVFISSTSKDLLKHREAALKACLDAGFHPIGMENFVARSEDAVTACLKEVAEADLFIGIYAWRYGYIPPESECSITEMEYIKARELKKTCFCFVVDPSYTWPFELKDIGINKRLLEDFKKTIDSKVVRSSFTSPEDLGQKIAATLARWLSQSQPIAKPVEDTKLIDIEKLKAQIAKLQRDLDKAKQDHIYLLRNKPKSGLSQWHMSLYILIGTMVLCAVGGACSQSTTLGVIVLLAIGALGAAVFMMSQQKQRNFNQNLFAIENRILDLDNQIHEAERQLQRL